MGGTSVAPTTGMISSLLQVAAVGALLAPLAAATRLAGAIARTRLEADRAATALAQLGIHERPRQPLIAKESV